MKMLHNVLISTILASITASTRILLPIAHDQELLHASQQPCEDANRITREDRFSFDIDWRHGSDGFAVHEDIHVMRAHVKGFVRRVKGEQAQKHSFEVLIESASSEQQMLDSLEMKAEEQTLFVKRSQNDAGDTFNVSLQVNVTIAVRPLLLQMGSIGTTITTHWLPIYIWPGLSFATYSMSLSSHYGSIMCQGMDTFTAHKIDVCSKYGLISGNWLLPSAISFETKYGNIDVDLIPKQWSSGPGTPGDLSVKSKYGNINIRMPFEKEKLSLRNSTTNIVSKSGVIKVSLVHGASTTIRTKDGTIMATLMPYWAFYEWQGVQHNFITTECSSCDVKVDILNPVVVDSYYKTQPLYFTKSVHTVGDGAMHLSYSSEWAGEAEWRVKRGVGHVSGEDYEVVERGWNHGKIKRRFGSHMDAEVNNGLMELVMKA